jgi:hypothetical protein
LRRELAGEEESRTRFLACHDDDATHPSQRRRLHRSCGSAPTYQSRTPPRLSASR